MTARLGPLPAPRVGAGVTFDVAEGRALDVLATLLGRGRPALVTVAARFDAPRRELLEAGARRIASSVGQFLAFEGGYRERTVLRDGRRVSGRVWSPSLGEGFAPRYTLASRSLWLNAAASIPTLTGLDASPEAARKAARLAEGLVEATGTASGDWVFYAIAHASVRAFRLTTFDETTLQRRLREGSPLATLLYAEDAAPRESLRDRLRRLLAPESARAVECIEGRLARSWTRRAAQSWEARLAPDELTRRWGNLGVTLHAWLDALDLARRMDLARPLLGFAKQLVRGPLSEGGEAVRDALTRAPGLRSIRDRDALLAAVSSVADVGARLLRRREELAGERYGDERYEEAQVYLRDADAALTPSRRKVEGVARALSGVLG